MLTPEEAETLVGHAVGGVCPFAVCEGVTIYLDESLKRFETVFPACGSSNSAIELNISELENYSGYQEWVDVCKLLSQFNKNDAALILNFNQKKQQGIKELRIDNKTIIEAVV